MVEINGRQTETITNFQSADEAAAYRQLSRMLFDGPISGEEVIAHLGLYLDRSALGHILFLYDVYSRILDVHGVIMEFGTRWGRNLSMFTEFRNIFEPRNATRRVIGFDTFAGFPAVHEQDGTADGVVPGAYAVAEGYETRLGDLLAAHEKFGLRAHIQKFELVKGNASETLPEYLDRHPETVIALAYLDLDLYQGTRDVLELIGPRLVKGSVVVFDEVCLPHLPGETVALLDTWGLSSLRLQRTPASQLESFVVME